MTAAAAALESYILSVCQILCAVSLMPAIGPTGGNLTVRLDRGQMPRPTGARLTAWPSCPNSTSYALQA
jgi:hypothetical protein